MKLRLKHRPRRISRKNVSMNAKVIRENTEVFCYKCGRFGTVKYKPHKVYSYPQYASASVINPYRRKDDTRRLKGSVYLSEAKQKYDLNRNQLDELIRDRNVSDTQKEIAKDEYNLQRKKITKDAYAIKYTYDRYYPCVYHYSKELYLKQKQDYENGSRKSEPNGVIFHYYRPPGHEDRRKKTKGDILRSQLTAL